MIQHQQANDNTYFIPVFTLPLYDVRLLSEQSNEDMQSQRLITSVHIMYKADGPKIDVLD